MSKTLDRALENLRTGLREDRPAKASPAEMLAHAKDEAEKDAVVALIGIGLGALERIADAMEAKNRRSGL